MEGYGLTIPRQMSGLVSEGKFCAQKCYVIILRLTYCFRLEPPAAAAAAAFTPVLGLVISGGLTSSVRHTVDGLKFKELSPLPVILHAHCMVALGDKTLFVTGGFSKNQYNNQSYVYESNKWHLKPGLSTSRTGMWSIKSCEWCHC